MGMKITDGRGFIEKDTNDLWNVIINQAFAEKFALKEPFTVRLAGVGEGKGMIVGIVEDFNFESLHSEVEPLAFFNCPDWISYGLIKMKSASYTDMKSVISNLKSVWKEISPDFPIEYNFLDESLDRQYKAEERFEKAFLCFSLFAILIACLGLFGLTAYTVEQRTKEISTRKILGATVTGITFMLSKQFVILVLLSNIIAWPIAYYVTNNWLKDFAYRINIDLWIFLASGTMALVIALLTVCSYAIKAAMANPVESLRYE
jgi:putative ABC transport system permease protein